MHRLDGKKSPARLGLGWLGDLGKKPYNERFIMKFSQKLNGHIIPEKQTLITKRTKIFAFCLFHARQIKQD
ncbi:hypothetical protein CH624_00395 [Haemophilus influenzae]|nr:hypothetical protein CH624_00395 [Haemophilus influenzae]KIP50649.1 hypothetical protein SU58_03245 [Haemophilus influenzae]RFN98266.1 hypothetical protein CH623_01115 [Haemophilus influenzae]